MRNPPRHADADKDASRHRLDSRAGCHSLSPAVTNASGRARGIGRPFATRGFAHLTISTTTTGQITVHRKILALLAAFSVASSGSAWAAWPDDKPIEVVI